MFYGSSTAKQANSASMKRADRRGAPILVDPRRMARLRRLPKVTRHYIIALPGLPAGDICAVVPQISA